MLRQAKEANMPFLQDEREESSESSFVKSEEEIPSGDGQEEKKCEDSKVSIKYQEDLEEK
jgi:hypothetical protein